MEDISDQTNNWSLNDRAMFQVGVNFFRFDVTKGA